MSNQDRDGVLLGVHDHQVCAPITIKVALGHSIGEPTHSDPLRLLKGVLVFAGYKAKGVRVTIRNNEVEKRVGVQVNKGGSCRGLACVPALGSSGPGSGELPEARIGHRRIVQNQSLEGACRSGGSQPGSSQAEVDRYGVLLPREQPGRRELRVEGQRTARVLPAQDPQTVLSARDEELKVTIGIHVIQ